jgi:hypothetical protein
MTDFYTMSEPDLLHYMGIDAQKWAEAFCAIKEQQGWSADDIDFHLMTTWFANAIQAGDTGSEESPPPIHAASYSAGLKAANEMVGALWSDLFNKDLVKAAGADFFDKWRQRIKDLDPTMPRPSANQ